MNTKKRKIAVIQVMRVVVQIIFFIILPGLYISAFAGVKQLYTSIYNQDFQVATVVPQLVALFATIIVTMLVGRFFCGWMCAFGTLGDFIYKISKLVMKKKIIVDEKVDRVLKYLKYVILVVLVAAGWSLGMDTFQNANPWDAFGMLFTVGKTPDLTYVLENLAPAFGILMLILVMSFFIERFFCRYLCPMGAIFAITSKLRFTTIVKPTEKCGNCRICTKSCPMGISLYKSDVSKSAECINCYECVSSCPRKNVSVEVLETDIKPVLAGAMAVTVITGVYYAGSFATDYMGLSSGTVVASAQQTEKLYEDGTYEGSGIGFRGQTTTVSVTVADGLISDIEIVSNGDDKEFFDRAYASVVPAIIESQSSNVDAVSGATYSSNGIMDAVADALSGAGIASTTETSTTVAEATTAPTTEATTDTTTDTTTESTTQDSQTDNQEEQSAASQPRKEHKFQDNTTTDSSTTEAAASDSTQSDTSTTTSQSYQDGTYEGSGTGYRGATTTVSVTVKSGAITDVSLVSMGDDEPFFNRAFPSVVADIISNQTSDVDAVSGATYSSNGIMGAVADALTQAVTTSN